MSETKRLGRGLEALLGAVISREQAEASGALRELPIGSVLPNPYQPRTHVDEDALVELTASIEASGLLQPVIVRPRNGKFRADRRRAPLARDSAPGLGQDPGGREGSGRQDAAHARPHRKPAARRPDVHR